MHGRQIDNCLGTCQLRVRGFDGVGVAIWEIWGDFGIQIAQSNGDRESAGGRQVCSPLGLVKQGWKAARWLLEGCWLACWVGVPIGEIWGDFGIQTAQSNGERESAYSR